MLLSTLVSAALAALVAAQNSTSSSSTTSRSRNSATHNATLALPSGADAETVTIGGAASVSFGDPVPTAAPASGSGSGNGGTLGGHPDDSDAGFTFPTNTSWWVLGAGARQPNTLQLHFPSNTTALRIFLTNSDTSLLKRTVQLKTVIKPADGTTTFTLDTAKPLYGAQPGKGFVLVAQFANAPSVSSQRFELKPAGSAPSYPPGYTPSPDNTVYPSHKAASGAARRVAAGVAVAVVAVAAAAAF
ncbi:hypothetical protein Q8F55_003700 [Vanrija albida]|uniref:Galactose oxidase-like Early set domain-containing protein n=1 Tax=Vanrija albida TaxID=181172 RepID=A0ABR3Q4P7_9TREE